MTPPEQPYDWYDWEDDESFDDWMDRLLGRTNETDDPEVMSDEEAEIEAIEIEMKEGDLIALTYEVSNWCFKLNLLTWDEDVAERLAQEAQLWLITQD